MHPYYLRSPYGAVHLEVAAHEGGEGQTVDEHEEDNIAHTQPIIHFKRQANSKLPEIDKSINWTVNHYISQTIKVLVNWSTN